VLALQGITLPDVEAKIIKAIPNSRADIIVCRQGGTGSASAVRERLNFAPCSEKIYLTKNPLARSRGSLLFTHFGVSGPVVLDVSHAVSGQNDPQTLVLRCDLLPDILEERLDRELERRRASAGKRRSASLLDDWLPRRMGETLVALACTPSDRPVAELSKTEYRRLIRLAKQLDIPVAGTMGFRKAELTAGGVSLEEVDSRTMQSRLVPNLFFAGELLDLNGPVGGYNFQAAFSTGWLAGESV
jgi:predicted Rossmann fold flavoprotein